MDVFTHIALFLSSAAVIWFFAGTLINAVNRVAMRFHKSGFGVAFVLLGFLTSISEISVAVNSTINKVPQVSIGNLVGASFVLLALIIPILAIAGNGIKLRRTISPTALKLSLVAIILPALFVIDGNITRGEGILAVLVYITVLFALRGHKSSLEEVRAIQHNLAKNNDTIWDSIKILIGAIFIFIAGHFLVEEAVYFSNILSVPSSLIGLILLSVGTNVPELVIAFRSILSKHKDIAFGDYIGSAVTNTPIFGILALVSGKFAVEASEFIATTILMLVAMLFFYFFAKSRDTITRKEGLTLLVFYVAFLVVQTSNLIRFSTD